jgi:ubiquitin-protein ligase
MVRGTSSCTCGAWAKTPRGWNSSLKALLAASTKVRAVCVCACVGTLRTIRVFLTPAVHGTPGGTFVLRVMFPQDYPFCPFQLRLLTPLYHPTIGPGGVVGVLGFDPYASLKSAYVDDCMLMVVVWHIRGSGWSPAIVHNNVVIEFVKQLQAHPLSPKTCQQIETEIAQVGTFASSLASSTPYPQDQP